MTFVKLLQEYGTMYGQAVLATWWMTAFCFVGAMVLGLGITIVRVCPIKPARMAADFYVQVFRNIPGVALLMLVAYALPYLGVLFDWTTCVLVAAVLICSAFASENYMTGINTVGVGQIEAARSLGLTFMQMMRQVVIPQALRSSVLPMTNLLIATMLTTAIAALLPVSAPHVRELTAIANFVGGKGTFGIVPFLISAAFYMATSLAIGYAGNKLDKRVRIMR